MARGFLDEADIPCRLVSDDAGGGASYVGGLAGAWVIVSEVDAEAAVEVLSSAGMQLGSDEPSGPAVELARRADSLTPVGRSDLGDINQALEKAQKDEFKHWVLCLFGVSPAAVIPALGLMAGGEMALLAILSVLVFLSEAWKAVRSGREVKRWHGALVQLEEETRE